MLDGYKTYILAALGGFTMALFYAGVIEWEFTQQILAILGFGTAAALRNGIEKK